MTDRARDVYENAIRKEFAFLKETDALADLHARGIVLRDGLGMLVPLCELHAGDARLIDALGRWRGENESAFPTIFPVTPGGTARWIRAGVLGVEDRVLFLVLDRTGHPVGHLGFAGALRGDRAMEVDNVVRGEAGQGGLMSAAMEALIGWAEEMFAPKLIHLRVFSDNDHAVRFYERLGFHAVGEVPLRREESAGGIVAFVEDAPSAAEADRSFLKMAYAPAREEAGEVLTAGPSMSAREASYALDAVRTGWNARYADYHDAFARTFADYIGVRFALPTSSCTGALHLALASLGIGPGDEVVVPDLTWVATANAVAYTGATPVFADVQERGWCLDPDAFERAITPRTKAVMPVHLYGHPADMGEITRIAREHGLRVVEDAAPSIGAETAGARTGSFGDFAGFSFQGAKLLVTGEGGMLVTDDEELYERAKYLWTMGHEGDFWIGEVGFKYRMPNVAAAIGLGQIERADEHVEAKRRIFGWYEEELALVEGVELSHEAAHGRSIHWMTSARLHDVGRDAIRAALKAAGIDTRPVFPAISRYPMWERRQAPGAVAHAIGSSAINLPSGVRLRRDDVARVGAALREAVDAVRRDGLPRAA